MNANDKSNTVRRCVVECVVDHIEYDGECVIWRWHRWLNVVYWLWVCVYVCCYLYGLWQQKCALLLFGAFADTNSGRKTISKCKMFAFFSLVFSRMFDDMNESILSGICYWFRMAGPLCRSQAFHMTSNRISTAIFFVSTKGGLGSRVWKMDYILHKSLVALPITIHWTWRKKKTMIKTYYNTCEWRLTRQLIMCDGKCAIEGEEKWIYAEWSGSISCDTMLP